MSIGDITSDGGRKVLILFGSQTGNAESIAKNLHQTALQKHYDSTLACLNEFDKVNFYQAPVVIIVCSTTGNGDVPDNALSFYRSIKKRTHTNETLAHMKYTVLGLGDTNYEKFCGASKALDKRIQELGAKRFYNAGFADDATGLEDVVEPWIEGLWNRLEDCFPSKEADKQTATPVAETTTAEEKKSTTSSDSSGEELTLPEFVTVVYHDEANNNNNNIIIITNQQQTAHTTTTTTNDNNNNNHNNNKAYTQHNPYPARIIGARYLTSSASEKQVMHLELDLGDSAIKYHPGDAIGVLCANDEEEVAALLSRLGIERPEAVISLKAKQEQSQSQSQSQSQYSSLFPHHIKFPCTIRDAFRKYCDISCVHKPLLRVLAAYCSNPIERQCLLFLSDVHGQNEFRRRIQLQRCTLLDVLNMFPSCKPSLGHLLQCLEPIQPRYYSISCSPLQNPNSVHIAFTVVSYTTPPPDNRTRKGLCSNAMHRLATKWLNSNVNPTASATTAESSSRTSNSNVDDCHNGSGDEFVLPIFLKPTPEFYLPRDNSAPIIMVGPGTGIAPFRGFIQHKACLARAEPQGHLTLFYGCRKSNKDFLYRDELRRYEKEAAPTKVLSPVVKSALSPPWVDGNFSFELLVAFSQDTEGGMWYGGHYVQDIMLEKSRHIYDTLFKNHGYIYVCGDANSMAKDVHRVLTEIVQTEGKVSNDEAKAMLERLMEQKRYQKDVWT